MYKSNTLFDTSKLVQRPIATQRNFEIEYFDFLKALPNMIDMAFEKTKDEQKGKMPLSILKQWFPTTMNGNLLSEVGKQYPLYIKRTDGGDYCLLIDYKYECYLKKLIPGSLLPSYNHSKTSRARCEQKAPPNQDPIPLIFIGYTSNKTNDKITGYYASCIMGKERIWVSDLTAIEPNSLNLTNMTEAPQSQAPIVSIKIGIRKNIQ
jgi:hypothetical protein